MTRLFCVCTVHYGYAKHFIHFEMRPYIILIPLSYWYGINREIVAATRTVEIVHSMSYRLQNSDRMFC